MGFCVGLVFISELHRINALIEGVAHTFVIVITTSNCFAYCPCCALNGDFGAG